MFTSAFPPSSPELSNGQVGLYIMLIPHRLKGNHHIWGVHVITLVVVGQFCFSLFTGGFNREAPKQDHWRYISEWIGEWRWYLHGFVGNRRQLADERTLANLKRKDFNVKIKDVKNITRGERDLSCCLYEKGVWFVFSSRVMYSEHICWMLIQDIDKDAEWQSMWKYN